MNKNQTAVSIFNKLADVYQSKFMDVSLYSDSLDFFCDTIKKPQAEILELACGPGNITKYLLNKRPDLKILGTDLSVNMVKLAEINNPTAHFKIIDCRTIDKINSQYEGLICGFCLPYLCKEECEKLISDAAKLLKAKGVIYISTMEDNYSRSAYKKGSSGDEIFMHYYEEEHLTKILEENGFKILKIDRKKYPAADGTITTDLILIAQQQGESFNDKPAFR